MMELGAGLVDKVTGGSSEDSVDNCFPDLKFEDRIRGFCIFSILGSL